MSTFDEPFNALEKVVKSLDDVPYCSATFPWDISKTLFYKSSDVESRYLNFPAEDSQLERLLGACEPATEGVDCKAGKIDSGNLSMPFSPYDEGLVGVVAETLLYGRFEAKDIKVVLHKLNVYAPGGFSKAQVDTPNDPPMFGSLVVILPTVHEGGSIILRHGGKEWTFNSADAVGTTPSTQAAFVASNSDVEHEVKAVSSGFLVTLTYNLYHSLKPSVISKEVKDDDLEIREALVRLLKDPTSFPEGGFIGFGLIHKYPLDMGTDEIKVSDIKGHLKGTDATIKRACDLLSLPVSIKAAYEADDQSVLLDKIINIEYHIDGLIENHLESQYQGEVVSHYHDSGTFQWDLGYPPIVWVRLGTGVNDFSSTYLTQHHRFPLAQAQGEVCMIAEVPPAEERANFGVI